MKSIITCSGKGSRFGSEKPLVKINGEVLVERLIKQFSKIADKVFITVNVHNYSEFIYLEDKFDNVNIVLDDSYSGNLTAINKVIKEHEIKDDVVVSWGDVYYKKIIIPNENKNFTIPVVKELNPYVSFLTDLDGFPHDVLYSKTSYRLRNGYHDQCYFFINKSILNELKVLSSKIDEEEKQLLELVNYLYTIGNPASLYNIGKPVAYTFNTIEELKIIKEELK